jgi:hypothetical protein
VKLGGCACHGAPRDLGLDQGRAAGEAIRRAVADLPAAARLESRLGLAVFDGRTARVGRDLDRHFPHMAERTSGLASGARVPRGELVALLARERRDRPESEAAASTGALLAVAPERSRGGALLGRTLGWPEVLERDSAPDADFRSREIAVPWLVPALAGVNECGLAVAGAALRSAADSLERCAAPALLLVQDCLQRFDTVQKAIEWCRGRPAGGSASILMADASGDVAEVVVQGASRRVRRPTDGLLVGTGSGGGAGALAKALAERARVDPGVLREVLRTRAGGRPNPRTVVVDPSDPGAALLG